MISGPKPKLDLPTVRALVGDDQSFSQRGLILELIDRCEAAEAKLAERSTTSAAMPALHLGPGLTFADLVGALSAAQEKREKARRPRGGT